MTGKCYGNKTDKTEILCRVDRGSLIGNVLCEERPIRREEASPAYSWEKNVLGRK